MASSEDSLDLNFVDESCVEAESSEKVSCPVCQTDVSTDCINVHLDRCLNSERKSSKNTEETPPKPSFFKLMKRTNPDEDNVSRKSIKTRSRLSSGGTKGSGSLSNFLTSPKNVNSKASVSPRNPESNGCKSVIDLECEPEADQVPRPRASSSVVAPLAEQMRPSTLDEYVGQEKIMGPKTVLRKLLESHNVPSMILWGPPGCGKTSLAHVIAKRCRENKESKFVKLSATTSGVKEVKDAVEIAKNDQKLLKKKTILFIDEIHRFNKLQQDTFLPHVENGTITLIGATTENPSFSLNSALLSRCRVFILEKLSKGDTEKIIRRALQQNEVCICPDNVKMHELSSSKGGLTESALSFLSEFCDGDARCALNGLQMALASMEESKQEKHKDQNAFVLTVDDIKEGLQRTHILYDRAGDQHYDIISAYIKSMRGSDADAALYWLARMLAGGEDPRFVARRLVIFASEDVGMSDPNALSLAAATYFSCQNVGMPECRLNLAHCTVYMAKAGKSRACYDAFGLAEKSIQEHKGPLPPVPLHLRNAPTRLMKDMGCGRGYKMYAEKDRDLPYKPPGLGTFYKG